MKDRDPKFASDHVEQKVNAPQSNSPTKSTTYSSLDLELERLHRDIACEGISKRNHNGHNGTLTESLAFLCELPH